MGMESLGGHVVLGPGFEKKRMCSATSMSR